MVTNENILWRLRHSSDVIIQFESEASSEMREIIHRQMQSAENSVIVEHDKDENKGHGKVNCAQELRLLLYYQDNLFRSSCLTSLSFIQ